MIDSEEKDSFSQGGQGFIDDGGESVAIGEEAISEEPEEPVEIKKGSSAPADEGEEESSIKEKTPQEGGKKPEAKSKEEDTLEDDLPAGVVKRLAKMRNKQGYAEREAEKLRAEIATLKQAQQKQKDIGDKPDPSDFETELEYMDVLTDWKIARASAEQDARQQERDEENRRAREEAAAAERHQEVQTNLKKAEKKYPDFVDVVYKDGLPITQQMTDIMARFDNIGDVAYYLGKHPEECLDIANSDSIDQSLALKDISDTLKIKERKTTKAPAPIRPISTTGAGIKDLESMDYPEYKKIMEKAEKERRGG